MALDKKQKKQLDLDQKKLAQLRQQLSGAKKQLDDPDEVRRLEQDIATTQTRIDKLKEQA
jgi:ribosomal protein L29